MPSGHIDRLLKNKGIGFIVQNSSTDEIEFHWTAVSAGTFDQLSEGQEVEFESRPDHRDASKLRAINVRLARKKG